MTGGEPTPTPTRVRPADLRRLRWGQTVSMYGDELTSVALPSIALLTLNATPFQFGLLAAANYLPYPFLGLLVGAWVDRTRRRRILILADGVRFVAIASIAVSAVAGLLTITQLFLVGLVVGTASVFFNAAYQAFLPSIVRADDLTAANAKLSISETSSQVAGPPLAGILVSSFGAAGALFIDAASFLASVVGVALIRRPELGPGKATPAPRSRRTSTLEDYDPAVGDPPRFPRLAGAPPGHARRPSAGDPIGGAPEPRFRRLAGGPPRVARAPQETGGTADGRGAGTAGNRGTGNRGAGNRGAGTVRATLRRDIVEGLKVVFGDRLLRGLTLTSALSNLGRGMALELFLLFAYNGLKVSPGVAGFMLAAGNIGSLLGSLTCKRLTERLGLGPTLILGSTLKGLPWLLAPLTLLGGAIPLIVGIMIVSSYFVPVSNVATVTLRQSMVSRELQGRVAATTRTVTRTIIPLSAILGGALAQVGTQLIGGQAGLAAVLALGGLLWTGATVLLPRDRLRGLRSLDDVHRRKAATEGADDVRTTDVRTNDAAPREADGGRGGRRLRRLRPADRYDEDRYDRDRYDEDRYDRDRYDEGRYDRDRYDRRRYDQDPSAGRRRRPPDRVAQWPTSRRR